MSHTFTDQNLLTWEAFASTGHFGLAAQPRIVFNCLSDPTVPPRFVEHAGDEADTEEQVLDYSEERLRELLRESIPLE